MGIRHGQIKPDVFVSSFEPSGDGHLKVSLRQWKRMPRQRTIVVVGHVDDDNIGVVCEVVGFEGEWPSGRALLTFDGGPYELNDPCDDPLGW